MACAHDHRWSDAGDCTRSANHVNGFGGLAMRQFSESFRRWYTGGADSGDGGDGFGRGDSPDCWRKHAVSMCEGGEGRNALARCRRR